MWHRLESAFLDRPLNQTLTPIPMLDLRAQYASIREEIEGAITSVLESQQFILGSQVAAFEEEIARYCGVRYAVGVASGTDGLVLALRAAHVGPGDEVIVPSFTFIATASSVSLLGAKPVFVDIQPDTFNLDPEKITRWITARTKAIIPVHLYGQPAEMDPILEIARRLNLCVVEDNAQAIGATYKGKRTGSIGDLGCLSFYPSKNLGGYGDGGVVVTDSEEHYKHLRMLRSHGETRKYFSEEQGWNSRLDEIQAAILRVKLRHLDAWNTARRRNAARYDTFLESVRGLTTPHVAAWAGHVFHQYTIRIPQRDPVQKALAQQGIVTTVYYPRPIHLQPIYSSLCYLPGDLPEAERAAREVLSLPMYAEMTQAQIGRVVDAITRALVP